MKKRLGERGFHLWIIPIIIVILGSIGFTGWYVWDKNKADDSADTTNPTATPTLSVTPTPTPTPDPTADWQTYTDSAYGFSFKYPSNMSPTTVAMDEPYYTDSYLKAIHLDGIDLSRSVYIVGVFNTSGKSATTFITELVGSSEAGSLSDDGITEVSYGSQIGYHFIIEGSFADGALGNANIAFIKGSTLVKFCVTNTELELSSLLEDETLNNIASTFEFN